MQYVLTSEHRTRKGRGGVTRGYFRWQVELMGEKGGVKLRAIEEGNRADHEAIE